MEPEHSSPLQEFWSYIVDSVAPADEGTRIYERREDVIYGRKDGMALTMDVFRPREGGNGRALVWVVSALWFSTREAMLPAFVEPMVARGYTVFAVLHGSQPRYPIPDIIPDIHRAVRYIRFHAAGFGVDPDRIGIYGGSAGGHLSLMLAVGGRPGRLITVDPVERVSSRVQAAACFFPPTDFLNYGGKGRIALGIGPMQQVAAAFAFHRYDNKANLFRPITDDKEALELGRQISPAQLVSDDDPPVLLYHGDADLLVPLQQSEWMVERLRESGVEAELRVKPGGMHGWLDIARDLEVFADWFDRHLAPGG